MPQRKATWLRAAVPAVALAMALTACGSDDSGDDGSGGGSADGDANGAGQVDEGQPEQPEQPEATEDTGSAGDAQDAEAGEGESSQNTGADASAGGAEQPGGSASGGGEGEAGAEAPDHVVYFLGETSEPILYGFGHGGVANFAVTVERVDVGEPTDIDGPGKPASVYFTIEHTMGEDVHNGDLGSLFTLSATGEDGSETFEPEEYGFEAEGGCPADSSEPEVVGMGDTFSSCLVFVIPDGSEPSTVHWSQDPNDVTPPTWRLTPVED